MKQLQGLLALIEISAAGSLAGAARRLGITPAAVSKSLARLEEQLGVRLVQRSTRTSRITAEGARFIDKARSALRLLDDAVAEVSQAAEEPTGVVRISTGVAFGRMWVVPALPALAERFPQLTLDGDLERHRCIQLRLADGGPAPWLFRVNGRRVAITPHAALVANDSEAVVELALAGGGIAQCGLYQALPELQAGRLKTVLAESHEPGAREFVLVYPHRQFLAPRVRVVAEALLAHFRATAALHVQPSELPMSHRAAPPGPRARRAS